MNILYLSYDGISDPLGQSQILPYLEGLAMKDHNIKVISFEKSSLEVAHRLKVTIIPLRYHRFPPVLSTLYDIYRLRQEVRKSLKTHDIDIIHCRSYITSLIGLWAKRKFHIKFIFDMRGFWADERVEGGLWNLKNLVFKWVYKYFKWKEKQFIAESDATISLTQNAKQEIFSWNLECSNVQSFNSTIKEKISVIPTCADLDLFNPLTVSIDDSRTLRDELGIHKDDFVLLYLGSLGTWYMLEDMLDFFLELKSERSRMNDQTKFLFLTKEQDEVRKAIKERALNENDFILSSSSRQEVPRYISICNASIFFILPTFSKKASAATKMGEIMGMGKPVITNSGWGDVEEILHKKNGIIVREFTNDEYSKCLNALPSLQTAGEGIRNTAIKYFALEKGIDTYNKIYKALIN